jgi:hypothetical protein
MSRIELLTDLVDPDITRFEFWQRVINDRGVATMAEVGVWRGEFAEAVFAGCPNLTTYYLLDPWRHLDSWNKPANVSNRTFKEYYQGVLDRTARWAEKRVVLRGRTTDVVASIPDGSLDFAYIDGDHSLRGISIDLIRMWPKIRDGGWIGGDDFSRTAWQHRDAFEPTLVFPFAVYFAEAAGAPIEALPRNQFIIHKSDAGFSFTDHMGRYPNTTVKAALDGRKKPAAKPAT